MFSSRRVALAGLLAVIMAAGATATGALAAEPEGPRLLMALSGLGSPSTRPSPSPVVSLETISPAGGAMRYRQGQVEREVARSQPADLGELVGRREDRRLRRRRSRARPDLRRLDRWGRAAARPGTRQGLNPVLSPDGGTIAFTRSKTRYRVDKTLAGLLPKGAPLPKTELAYSSTSTWLVDAGGGHPRRLTPWRDGLDETPTSFSPDGATLALTKTAKRQVGPQVVLADLASGGQVEVAAKAERRRSPPVAPRSPSSAMPTATSSKPKRATDIPRRICTRCRLPVGRRDASPTAAAWSSRRRAGTRRAAGSPTSAPAPAPPSSRSSTTSSRPATRSCRSMPTAAAGCRSSLAPALPSTEPPGSPERGGMRSNRVPAVTAARRLATLLASLALALVALAAAGASASPPPGPRLAVNIFHIYPRAGSEVKTMGPSGEAQMRAVGGPQSDLGPDHDSAPIWSPDGQTLAFTGGAGDARHFPGRRRRLESASARGAPSTSPRASSSRNSRSSAPAAISSSAL